MDIIIDNLFKEAYSLYFSDLHDNIVLEEVNGVFTKYDPEMLTDAVNIAKTAMSLNMMYSECYDKIVEKIIKKFPTADDIDRFILCIVMKIMIVRNSETIDSLLAKPRDIYKEVASKYFRIPIKKVSDVMIKKILAVKDESNYTEKVIKPCGWDEYFYNICIQIATNSKCLSRNIGAILVLDRSIISTGYNGPPTGVPSCAMRWKIDPTFSEYEPLVLDASDMSQCPRKLMKFDSGEGLFLCPAGHAERNVIVNAAKNGIATKNTTMYMACGIPCTQCLVEIINAGIKEIVVTSLKTYDKTSMYLLNQSSIGIRLFDFIKI